MSSLLEDLGHERPTELCQTARTGNTRALQHVFARSPVYAPRSDDGSTYRLTTRSGQTFLRVYDTYNGMVDREAGGPEADMEHSQTIGRQLRATLPDEVGILLVVGLDEEYIVAYPAAQPVHRVDMQ